MLILTGTYALAWGLVRGSAAVRVALRSLAADGEPTRALIDASRPVYARVRVRASARHALVAAAWLAVAAYGLLLATVGVEVFR